MTATITRHAKEMQNKGNTHDIEVLAANHFTVTSGTSDKVYHLFQDQHGHYVCNCDWHKFHRGGECSHVIALRRYLSKKYANLMVSAWTPVDVQRQHHTIMAKNDGVVFTSRSK